VPHLTERLEDRHIHARTAVSKRNGETMDRDLAVGKLLELDEPPVRMDEDGHAFGGLLFS
jgi:hypothetical protein